LMNRRNETEPVQRVPLATGHTTTTTNPLQYPYPQNIPVAAAPQPIPILPTTPVVAHPPTMCYGHMPGAPAGFIAPAREGVRGRDIMFIAQGIGVAVVALFLIIYWQEAVKYGIVMLIGAIVYITCGGDLVTVFGGRGPQYRHHQYTQIPGAW